MDKRPKNLVAPSILASNFGKLDEEITMINNSQADWIHLDVMDGSFVPNISFGIPIIKSIAKQANKPLDVHLMIDNPDLFVKQFKEAGADILTVHYEACKHLHRTIELVKSLNMQAGVAVNPHSSINFIGNIIHDIDVVCLMSVNPGFGGQKFINNTFEKVKQTSELRKKHNANFLIEIDGGVNLENAHQLIKNGADILVAGSTIFKSKNPTKIIRNLKFH